MKKESGRRKKAGAGGRIVRGVILVMLALAILVAISFWREYSRTESGAGQDVTISIEEGCTTKQVGNILKDAGLIRYKSAFYLKIYFSEYRGKLRYGEFTLNDGMCLDDLVEALVTGGAQKEERRFTIPEGYSIPMIAKKLEKEDIISADEFLDAVQNLAGDVNFAGQLPDKDKVLYQMEGFLFPDTYFLPETVTAEELIHKFLDEFQGKMTEERLKRAKILGMTMEEVVTRASLVQKETERAEEYPTVAGVINNRLEKNMNLQFDSTVVYAMSDGLYGVERVLYAHLELDSPYNTYKNKGLPPGPICNPSLEAIDGVLHPESHEYLYFQTDQVKNDGSNLYFKTYEEHAAAAATTRSAKENTTAEEN